MIGQLTVNISAKDPTRKCETFRAFVGSPSNVRIVDVPTAFGNWKISTVYFTVNYPDNRSVSKTCKPGVGVYVATIEGSTIPGKSLLGYTVKADGVDENNQPVIGYVLGKGDVEIVDADATLTPGETTHYIHVLDSRPDNPRKGDAYVENGTWRFFNGTVWTVLGGVSAGNSYVMSPVDKGGDGLWHRMIIVDGTIAYEREGVDEPPLAADKTWVLTQIGDAVSSEETRAKAAEQTNAEAIEAEAERAAAAEGENADAIEAEETRAKAAEQTNAEAIEAEAERASGAEDALNNALINEIARAGASEATKVPSEGNHTINGVKTFTSSPLVPTVASTDDDSQKAASTGWVSSKITAWWNAIKSTVTFAKAQVGLGNVDNTSDANKPVSTAMQTALDAKANDNAVVKLDGAQTITGEKAFTSGGKNVVIGGGVVVASGGFECSEDGAVRGSAFAGASMPKNPAVDTTVNANGLVEFSQGVTSAPFNCWVTVGRKSLADTNLQVIVTKGEQGQNYNNRVFQEIIPIPSGMSCYITAPVPKGAAVFVVGQNLTTSGLTIAQRFCKCYSEV